MNEPRLVLAVVGTPAPQGSKRHVGHGVMVESSAKVKPWRLAVEYAASSHMAHPLLIDEPVRVQMVFTFLRPKGHFRTGKNAELIRDGMPTQPQGMPDLSKLIRSTEDALTDAGVWRDDARVVSIQAAKVYAGEHPDALDVPGAVIRIWTANRG